MEKIQKTIVGKIGNENLRKTVNFNFQRHINYVINEL